MSRKTLYRQPGIHPDEAKHYIMVFILAYSGEHGYAPSVREITEAVGLLSTATTQKYLNELIAEDRLERDAKRSRTLRVKL